MPGYSISELRRCDPEWVEQELAARENEYDKLMKKEKRTPEEANRANQLANFIIRNLRQVVNSFGGR